MYNLRLKGFFYIEIQLLRRALLIRHRCNKELVELGHLDPNNYDSF
jgi:hypothetical protein